MSQLPAVLLCAHQQLPLRLLTLISRFQVRGHEGPFGVAFPFFGSRRGIINARDRLASESKSV